MVFTFTKTWEPCIGEELVCSPQVNNPHACYAVAVCKSGTIVGLVPKIISRLCWLFLNKSGTEIKCFVTDTRRYSSDLVQGGLEVPCRFKFMGGTLEQIAKVSALLRSTDSSTVCSSVTEE
uniref:Uncharacterized protein n=1 Tax=Amphimedon queenslandica TaxID=400682 RepID=A0A1X7T1W5_AMPQE